MNTPLGTFKAVATLTAGDESYEATYHGKPGRGLGEVAQEAVHKLLDEHLPPNDFDEIVIEIRPT
jgi:hypothetical protein